MTNSYPGADLAESSLFSALPGRRKVDAESTKLYLEHMFLLRRLGIAQ